MTRPQKVFRFLWRVNAILILVAAGAVTVGVVFMLVGMMLDRVATRRRVEAAKAVAVAPPDSRMSLSQADVVAGTRVMRARLHRDRGDSGLSGSAYGETRNVLFIQPGETAARWPLSDNQHVVSEFSDIPAEQDTRRTVATAVLVKPAGEITLLYERDRRLVLATFDAGSFAKRSEQEMSIPQVQ